MSPQEQLRRLNALTDKEFERVMSQAPDVEPSREPQQIFDRIEREQPEASFSQSDGQNQSGFNVQMDRDDSDNQTIKDIFRQIARDVERMRQLLDQTLEE